MDYRACLNSGQLVSALLCEGDLNLSPLQLIGIPIRHRGKQEALKIITRQADQGAEDEPLGVLPAHKL